MSAHRGWRAAPSRGIAPRTVSTASRQRRACGAGFGKVCGDYHRPSSPGPAAVFQRCRKVRGGKGEDADIDRIGGSERRHGGHAEFRGALGEILGADHAVEQGKLSVEVKVDEGI